MLLTLTSTHPPASDLSYLLAKKPGVVQHFSLSYGVAHVYYPEVSDARCTVALMLDIDPIGLVRGRPQSDVGSIAQYVNDRPYVASSFLSVAIADVFRSALHGRCKERPELAEQAIELQAVVDSLPCRGGQAFVRRLFTPLGYSVNAERIALDPKFPEWGESPYYRVTLRGDVRLSDLLSHLYVLIPVLDDEKHYWVGDDEVEKLETCPEMLLAPRIVGRRPRDRETIAASSSLASRRSQRISRHVFILRAKADSRINPQSCGPLFDI